VYNLIELKIFKRLKRILIYLNNILYEIIIHNSKNYYMYNLIKLEILRTKKHFFYLIQ